MVTQGSLDAAEGPRVVLLAEDNLVNQKIALAMLQKRGHQVDVANNGVEALAMVQEKSYAVVLMDLEMPEMGGLEATQREERERCMAAGMTGFITKPFRAEELYGAVEEDFHAD
jgi:CheY-like chemotaxis protein